MILGKKDRELVRSLKDDRITLFQQLNAANQEIENLQLIINAKDEEIAELKASKTTVKKSTNSTNKRKKKDE